MEPVSTPQSSLALFLSQVEQTRFCWIWTGRRDAHGYGICGSKRAHRLSWQFHHGEIPAGKFVCHHCDTPACVNPEHLFLGTAYDNNLDCRFKGRNARGATLSQALWLNGARIKRRNRRAEVAALRERDIKAADLADAYDDTDPCICWLRLVVFAEWLRTGALDHSKHCHITMQHAMTLVMQGSATARQDAPIIVANPGCFPDYMERELRGRSSQGNDLCPHQRGSKAV